MFIKNTANPEPSADKTRDMSKIRYTCVKKVHQIECTYRWDEQELDIRSLQRLLRYTTETIIDKIKNNLSPIVSAEEFNNYLNKSEIVPNILSELIQNALAHNLKEAYKLFSDRPNAEDLQSMYRYIKTKKTDYFLLGNFTLKARFNEDPQKRYIVFNLRNPAMITQEGLKTLHKKMQNDSLVSTNQENQDEGKNDNDGTYGLGLVHINNLITNGLQGVMHYEYVHGNDFVVVFTLPL